MTTTFVVILTFIGTIVVLGAISNLAVSREANPKNYLKSLISNCGETLYITNVGHSHIVVKTSYEIVKNLQGRALNIADLARLVDFSESKLRTYIGIPEPAVLKELEMTMGEWLVENQNSLKLTK